MLYNDASANARLIQDTRWRADINIISPRAHRRSTRGLKRAILALITPATDANMLYDNNTCWRILILATAADMPKLPGADEFDEMNFFVRRSFVNTAAPTQAEASACAMLGRPGDAGSITTALWRARAAATSTML